MDLSRIDLWTHKALEAEAMRRGIRDPHLRTRTELVRLILRSQYKPHVARSRKHVMAGLEALGQARELLTAAAEVLPKPLGKMVQLGVQLSLPFRRTSPGTIHAPERSMGADDRPSREPATDPLARATPVATAPSTHKDRQTGEETPAPQATVERFVAEPIRTHSMARLLARQGHRQRALAIYEELLARSDDDPTLVDEADILRAGGEVEGIGDELPAPPNNAALPPSADRIECHAAGEGAIGVTWQVTPQGTARAAAVLGQRGELAVRLVTISPDAERVVKSEITEYGPVTEAGTWRTGALEQASRGFVAIGLRSDRRFVSIAHTASPD